jgi:hypothetical protein
LNKREGGPEVRVYRGCFFIAALFTASLTAYADLQVLPLGHLKITDGEGGKINVEARCVPTRELILAICEKGHLKATFQSECHTFSSVWFPNRFDSPEVWLLIVGNPGVYCRVRGDECTVINTKDLGYDTSLSESALEESVVSPIQAATPAQGIDSGLFFFCGYPISPPYAVKYIKDDGKGIGNILINGISVKKKRIPQVPPRTLPELPSSGQLESVEDLCTYVSKTKYPQLLSARA